MRITFKKAMENYHKILRLPENTMSHFKIYYPEDFGIFRKNSSSIDIYEISDDIILITHGRYYNRRKGEEIPEEIIRKYEEKAKEIWEERARLLKENVEEFFAEIGKL